MFFLRIDKKRIRVSGGLSFIELDYVKILNVVLGTDDHLVDHVDGVDDVFENELRQLNHELDRGDDEREHNKKQLGHEFLS